MVIRPTRDGRQTVIEVMHPDFCTIRREWIMGGYMERKDGVYKLAARGKQALAS